MRRRVYVTVGCPSVRLSPSVPSSIDCSSGGRRVCCWRLQQISIDSSERRAAWRRRSAANAGSVLLRSDGGRSTETSSRRRCRRRFAGCRGAGVTWNDFLSSYSDLLRRIQRTYGVESPSVRFSLGDMETFVSKNASKGLPNAARVYTFIVLIDDLFKFIEQIMLISLSCHLHCYMFDWVSGENDSRLPPCN